MTYCCVPYCKSKSLGTQNVSFFQFPANIPLRELWIKNIRRTNWLPTDSHKVCSLHFKNCDIRDGLKVRKLVKDAAPTVFPDYPKHIQSKIIRENKPKKKPPRPSELVPQQNQPTIQINENAEDNCDSNITTQEDFLTPSFDISLPNVNHSFCANCVNCNANLRYRNRFDWTNRLAFPNWKFNLPRANEVPLMKIPVSDAIRFIYELTVDDLIRVGLTADNSEYGSVPSFDDVFVCKQCGDILSELYCAHRKLKYISDADAILRKAIKCKNLQPDVKNEYSYELQMEGLDLIEEDVEIDSEMQSQEDQDPLADNLYEKHVNTILCSAPSVAAVINSSKSNVSEINPVPVVRLKRLKAMQLPVTRKLNSNSVNVEENGTEENYIQSVNKTQEQNEQIVIPKIDEEKDLDSSDQSQTINASPEKSDSFVEATKINNISLKKTDLNSIQHLIEKHKEKRFSCDCGKRFSTNGLLRRHIRDLHQFRKKFKCETCGLMFASKNYLRGHQTVHSERKHVCSVCGRAFNQSKHLRRHFKALHPNHPVPIQQKLSVTKKNTNDKPKRTYKRRENIKDKSDQQNKSKSTNNTEKEQTCFQRKYECNVCGRTLSSKSAFEDHMRLHTGEKPFKCKEPDCEMTFRTLLNLKVHKSHVHTDDFPFPCKHEGCDRKFKLSGSLRSHCFSQHPSMDKLFVCDICGKAFKFNNDLQKHIRTHDDLSSADRQKFKCENCERKFSDKYNLNLHVKVVHTKEISFQCEQCGKCFSTAKNLRNHKRVHSGEKPYKCDKCNKQWVSHAGLWWHQRHSHKS